MGSGQSNNGGSNKRPNSELNDSDGDKSSELEGVNTLNDLLKLWQRQGSSEKFEDYKVCANYAQELIKTRERAKSLKKKEGVEYGELIREWMDAVKSLTNSIPTPRRFREEEYEFALKVTKSYNDIMKKQGEDFEEFAGSLKLTVVSQKSIQQAISVASGKLSALASEKKSEIDSEEKREPQALLDAVLTVHDLPRLIKETKKYVQDMNVFSNQHAELKKKVNEICLNRVDLTQMDKLAQDLESNKKEFFEFCQANPNISERAARIQELTKSGPMLDLLKIAPQYVLDLEAAKESKVQSSSKIESLTTKISKAADDLVDTVSNQANSIVKELTEPTVKWRDEFLTVSKKQIHELNHNSSVYNELKKNKMSILYVSWSDVGRAQGSCVGSNITDMQFFAIPPLALRPAAPRYMDLDEGLFCNFPAVRSPNFTDEVDIRTASTYSFKVRDHDGEVKTVTMAKFLEQLGKYVTDLDPSANWGDKIDEECRKMQVASQFSVLPLLKCADNEVELGISAFGYQQKNLHIVIGPNGDIGWAPEGPGYKRIFFRDTAGMFEGIVDACAPYFEGKRYICNIIYRFCTGFAQELRAISLAPEDRKEVSKAFFKTPPKNETIEEEAKRYAKVENKLIHIQIQMERGEEVGDFSSTEMFSCDGLTQIAKELERKKNLRGMVEKTRKELKDALDQKFDSNIMDYEAVAKKEQRKYGRFGQNAIAECAIIDGDGDWLYDGMRSIGAAGGARRSASPDLGLLLARVKMGDSVGRADETDVIPSGSTRTKGVAVRVTEMFYSVAVNAQFTQPRIYRFMQQMSFAKRANDLDHGSLVTGKGNWKDGKAPITLEKATY